MRGRGGAGLRGGFPTGPGDEVVHRVLRQAAPAQGDEVAERDLPDGRQGVLVHSPLAEQVSEQGPAHGVGEPLADRGVGGQHRGWVAHSSASRRSRCRGELVVERSRTDEPRTAHH